MKILGLIAIVVALIITIKFITSLLFTGVIVCIIGVILWSLFKSVSFD